MIDEADDIIINNYAIIEYIEEKYSHLQKGTSLISGNLRGKAEIRRLVDWYDNKFYNEDIILPDKLPLSMEYDILPIMDLHYKILESDRYDIGTPERLERFKKWYV